MPPCVAHWQRQATAPNRSQALALTRRSKLAKTEAEVGKVLPTGFSWQTVANLIPLQINTLAILKFSRQLAVGKSCQLS
jgi:hypothetical protein